MMYFVDVNLYSAIILMVVFQLMVWFLAAVVSYVEMKLSGWWPCLEVKAFMILSLVFNVALLTYTYNDSSESSSDVLKAVGVTTVNALLLISWLIKDLIFNNGDDIEKNSLLAEFHENNPIRDKKDDRTRGSYSWLSSSEDSERNVTVPTTKKDHFSFTKTFFQLVCCFSRDTMSPEEDQREDLSVGNYPTTIESALEKHISSNEPSFNRSFRQNRKSDDSGEYSLLQLMREKMNPFGAKKSSAIRIPNGKGYDSGVESDGRSISTSSFFGGSYMSNPTSIDPHAQQERLLSISTDVLDESNSLGSNKNEDSKMSRALMHVMTNHQTKLMSVNPIVEPRGGGNNSIPYMDPHDQRLFDSNFTNGMSSGMVKRTITCQVTVVRWGFRRPQSSILAPIESNLDPSTQIGLRSHALSSSAQTSKQDIAQLHAASVRQGFAAFSNDSSDSHRSEIERNGSTSPLANNIQKSDIFYGQHAHATSLDNRSPMVNDTNKLPVANMEENGAEVEFELSIVANRIISTNSGDPYDSTDTNKNAGASNNKNVVTKSWAIWKTKAEITSFQTSMVTILGDLAPRRPRLKSTIKPYQEMTQNEFNSDMRSISVYLNAILRSHDVANIPTLMMFLDIQSNMGKLNPSNQTVYNPNAQNSSSPMGNSHRPLSISNPIAAGFGSPTSNNNRSTGNSTLHNSYYAESHDSFMQASLIQQQNQKSKAASDYEVNASTAVKSGNQTAQQEKWRKLFFHMRVKLKPHEIGLRCRLFEGVITGGEVAGWLIRSNNNSNNPNDQYQHARDRAEACAIGQELLSCGLLVPVCWGYSDEEDEETRTVDPDMSEMMDSSSVQPSDQNVSPNEVHHPQSNGLIGFRAAIRKTFTSSNASNSVNAANFEANPALANPIDPNSMQFSDLPGYIYRFQMKSTTAGIICTLFGAAVAISIPSITVADDTEELKPSRDTMGFSIFSGGKLSVVKPTPVNQADAETIGGNNSTDIDIKAVVSSGGASGHVKYLVEATHGGDRWQTWKRYREFEQLQRALHKEGIRSEIGLPPKTFAGKFSRVGRSEMLEVRRAGLEKYLSAIAVAVITSHCGPAMIHLAQFLDEKYGKLRMDRID